LVGLRARHKARYAGAARASHRRAAPYVFALWWVTLAAGWASSTWIRDDIGAGSTWHFRVAWAAISTFSLAALLGVSMRGRPIARRVHPWVGLIGLALAIALAILGMNLLP